MVEEVIRTLCCALLGPLNQKVLSWCWSTGRDLPLPFSFFPMMLLWLLHNSVTFASHTHTHTHAEPKKNKPIKIKYVLKKLHVSLLSRLLSFSPSSPPYLSLSRDREDEINLRITAWLNIDKAQLSHRNQLFDHEMKRFQSAHHCLRNQTY